MKYIIFCLLLITQTETIKCLAQNSTSKNDVLRTWAAQYIIGKNDSAKSFIARLMKSEPDNYENILLHGLYIADKTPEEAKNDFQKAATICNCSEAYNCLAASYTQPKDYDSAIMILKQSLAVNPNQPKICALIGSDYFYEAISDNTLIDSAQLYDYKAYRLDTSDISILQQYTYFLSYYKSCSDSTIRYFIKLRQLDPSDSTANFYIGNCLLNKGHIFNALHLLTDAEQHNPNSAKYNFVLANCYLQTYNFCQANYFIKRAITYNTNDSNASIFFSMLIDNISKCEPSHPYDSLYYYLQLGDKLNLSLITSYKHTVDSINILISNFRDGVSQVDSLGKLAEYYYKAKNYKQASVCLDGIIESGVIDSDLYVQRITLYLELGQLNEAQDFINSRLKVISSYYLLFLGGIVNLELTQFETAKKIFEKIQKDGALPDLNDDINNYLSYIANNS